jgi:hypothetical protein
MEVTADRFIGCLLGLATGDALGAPYEGGPLERLVWRLIGRTSDGCLRWTDDTQMALDLALAPYAACFRAPFNPYDFADTLPAPQRGCRIGKRFTAWRDPTGCRSHGKRLETSGDRCRFAVESGIP